MKGEVIGCVLFYVFFESIKYMILSSFKYSTASWTLSEVSPLQFSTLLVGCNATGKTRTIKALQNVTSFMQSQRLLFNDERFEAKLVFSEPQTPKWVMEYELSVSPERILLERLVVDGSVLIERTQASATYRGMSINPPEGKLVVQTRRDSKDYPEIEKLMSWVEGVVYVSFSDINPYTIVSPKVGWINPIPFSQIVESLNNEDKEIVFKQARQLDYGISEMSTYEVAQDVKFVVVREQYMSKGIVDVQLSSGMLRVLYLLCFMAYLTHSDKLSLLLIDDLSEGLDYSRATQLGKLVFEYCEKDRLQLIASSNDAFLMDVVDVSNWQILRRNREKVSSINQATHPDLFLRFKMTGLSNFDLFSSDFINKYFSSSEQDK